MRAIAASDCSIVALPWKAGFRFSAAPAGGEEDRGGSVMPFVDFRRTGSGIFVVAVWCLPSRIRSTTLRWEVGRYCFITDSFRRMRPLSAHFSAMSRAPSPSRFLNATSSPSVPARITASRSPKSTEDAPSPCRSEEDVSARQPANMPSMQAASSPLRAGSRVFGTTRRGLNSETNRRNSGRVECRASGTSYDT